MFSIPTPVPLRSNAGHQQGLMFAMVLSYDVVEVAEASLDQRWRAEARAYSYRLLDRNERELLVYHWQPGPDFLGPDHPHLHVSAAVNAQVDALTQREIPLDRLHLPTGQVSITAIVRALITEFGVAPIRDDWRDVLDRADAADDAPDS